MTVFLEIFPPFAAASAAEAAHTLTPGGWATMLVSVSAVTAAFAWCLSRVLRGNGGTGAASAALSSGRRRTPVSAPAAEEGDSARDWEKTRTLDDLRRWERTGASLAVVGMPVGHSLSPLMHNAALAAADAPELAGWRYFKFEIPPDALGEALALFHGRGFRGLNLTLPHKVRALAHVARVDASAAEAGAANTLVWEEDGYAGCNTDGAGFARALRETAGVAPADAPVVLLGAGGAARAIAAAVLGAGCRRLWIGNRGAARREELLAELREKFPAARAALRGFALDEPPPALPDGAVVVNATSLGLRRGDPSPLPAALWRRGMFAFDIVYGAGETAFLREARERGVSGADGLPMLCWQGALAFELWTGRPAPARAMLDALARAAGAAGFSE